MVLRSFLFVGLALQLLPLAFSDDQLGSTMTMEQIRKAAGAPNRNEEAPAIDVQPAAEVVPALKYKLYPDRWDLKSDSALLHYNRAVIAYLQLPDDTQRKWTSSEWLSGEGDGEKPTQEDLADAVGSMEFMYQEIHALAMSEDFTWDHRLRKLTGPDVYLYQLNDVQEIRSLARMLQLKARLRILQDDSEGAIETIADGIRLAEFVGQGETLIHKLVGMAIQSMMRNSLEDLIGTPGCPNLYWALASIPRPLHNINESVLWELDNVSRIFPVLGRAENGIWSDDQAKSEWKKIIDDFSVLEGSVGADHTAIRTALAIIGATQVEESKQQLRQSGMSPEDVDKLPGLQAVLIQTAQQMRKLGDNLGKAYLLPRETSRDLSQRQQTRFNEYLQTNRRASLAGIISGLLFPAVQQAAEAELRTEMYYHRLMTAESLRMYVAENQRLPESLDKLVALPAFPDPYTGQHFEYLVEKTQAGAVVTLKSAGPKNYPKGMTLKLRFKSLQ